MKKKNKDAIPFIEAVEKTVRNDDLGFIDADTGYWIFIPSRIIWQTNSREFEKFKKEWDERYEKSCSE